MPTTIPWDGTDIRLASTLDEASRRVASGLATQALIELRNRVDRFAALAWLRNEELSAGVRGFGFGVQWESGMPTARPCVYIFANEDSREALRTFPAASTFPEVVLKIDPGRGSDEPPVPVVPVRTQPCPVVRALMPASSSLATLRKRLRPARGGCSIGHPSVSAGTLGIRVTRTAANGAAEPFVLSNAHVLAGLNAGHAGDAALQPSEADLGSDSDVIARLADFEALRVDDIAPNIMDAAIATPSSPDAVASGVYGIGEIPTWRALEDVRIGMPVAKVGRTSGLTTGVVLAVGVTYKIDYGLSRPLIFHDQIMTTPMASGGDSGSVLVGLGARRSVVGLILAGSDRMTIATPIEAIHERFNVSSAPTRWSPTR